jgi:hypothetical protein
MSERTTQLTTDTPPAPEYRPEIQSWLARPDGDRAFAIHEEAGRGGYGPRIATLTIDPGLDAAAAQRIATLIADAPALWQALREQNRVNLIHEAEFLGEFAEVTALLWMAAGRPPYAIPTDPPDEADYESKSRAAAGALAARLTGADEGRAAA